MSWLLPVRDGGAWVGAAARSALDLCEEADELLVIDDGSAEDPGPLLPADRRLRLLRQPPEGLVAALERGRALARHPFLARLDADDLALPGRIAAQLPRLQADPRLAVVGGQALLRQRVEGLDAEMFEVAAPAGMQAYVDWVNGLEDLHAALLIESPLFHPAVLMRAEAVAAVGGYRAGDLPEDYDLWLRLRAAGWGLAAVKQPVVRILDHPARLTRADPRYRTAAFRALKMAWLLDNVLHPGMRVAVWGAGKTGRPWIRWLVEGGFTVPAVIDPHAGERRQGRPVLPPAALPSLAVDRLLVAVGARGARDLIRAELGRLRPAWVEGRDWWAVA